MLSGHREKTTYLHAQQVQYKVSDIKEVRHTFDLFRDLPPVHVLAPLVSREHDVLVQLLGQHADLLERDGVDVGECLLTYLPVRG